jgi:hypothetical protein
MSSLYSCWDIVRVPLSHALLSTLHFLPLQHRVLTHLTRSATTSSFARSTAPTPASSPSATAAPRSAGASFGPSSRSSSWPRLSWPASPPFPSRLPSRSRTRRTSFLQCRVQQHELEYLGGAFLCAAFCKRVTYWLLAKGGVDACLEVGLALQCKGIWRSSVSTNTRLM